MNAQILYHDLKERGVILEAQGEYLKVDAPAGVLTEKHRAALKEFKPRLLKFLSCPQEEPEEVPERESVARWAGPGLIRIRDPFTGRVARVAGGQVPARSSGGSRKTKEGSLGGHSTRRDSREGTGRHDSAPLSPERPSRGQRPVARVRRHMKRNASRWRASSGISTTRRRPKGSAGPWRRWQATMRSRRQD